VRQGPHHGHPRTDRRTLRGPAAARHEGQCRLCAEPPRRPGGRHHRRRSPDRFRGENETLDPVGGHIPGAINRFFQDNLGPDGRFKQAAQLQEEFGKLIKGGDAHKVVAQCGSGVTACHNLLAMEAAGLDGARLYPGSWSEWCADPARPVATGA